MRVFGVGCLFASLVSAGYALAADPAADLKPAAARFVVYAAEDNSELGSSLFRVLRGDEKVSRFAKADTLQKAIESEADVLVLVLPQRELPKLDKTVLDALKKRKIVGIGFGAAQLFGKLGLEINGGHCAHGVSGPPSVNVPKSELLGEPNIEEPIAVFRDDDEPPPNADRLDAFAVYLPPGKDSLAGLDPIARWNSDSNYAPIVRQGNCVLIGVPGPATRWTAEFADLIRKTCLALNERQLKKFSTVKRALTKPGTYKFTLARHGSTDVPSGKSFYFTFSKSQQFSAKLEHAGSDNVMMLFMGQDENRNHWTRKDARQQEELTIEADITDADIESVGDRYWKLDITNFGAAHSSNCELTIVIQ